MSTDICVQIKLFKGGVTRMQSSMFRVQSSECYVRQRMSKSGVGLVSHARE